MIDLTQRAVLHV